MAIPTNSVWAAMAYAPPRGRCNYKQSLLGPTCPCMRFMLHPVKAATSFECDGCNHHASFHSLENPAEDAILKKWQAQESEKHIESAKQASSGAPAVKKRKRVKAKAEEDELRVVEVADMVEDEQEVEGVLGRTMALFEVEETTAAPSTVTTKSTARPRRGRRTDG